MTFTSNTKIDELFLSKVESYGDNPLYHFEETTTSYTECNQLVCKTAEYLVKKGLIKGNFVGLISTNRPEFVVGYLAILRAGGIVVPINPRLGQAELQYIIKDANIKLIIHPTTLSIQIDGVSQTCTISEQISFTFVSVKKELSGVDFTYPDNIKDLAVCIYTSGTTGRAKGALLTHQALMHNARMCSVGMKSKLGQECLVAVLPLFHAFGASACMLQAIWIQSAILIIEQFQPHDIFKQMQKFKASVFIGVPAMYGVMAKTSVVHEIPSWRLNICGGAPLPAAIYEAFMAKFGMDIYEGDGPTECGPATSINPVGGLTKVGTIGFPLCDVEMKIVDPDGTELPADQVGEIIVKSPSNFCGYLNQREASRATIKDGWVFTGDLGLLDHDGYFSIVDRKKDMLIVGGLNVYPREVEEYLMYHPAIAECAVVGKEDGMRGEVPVVFVALKEACQLSLPELKKFLRDKIAIYKIPRNLFILPALPRNATGKILKTVLRQEL